MNILKPGIVVVFAALAGCTSAGRPTYTQSLSVTNNGRVPITNKDTAYYGHNPDEYKDGIVDGAVQAANDFVDRVDGDAMPENSSYGVAYNRGYTCMQGQVLATTARNGSWYDMKVNGVTYDQWTLDLVQAIWPALEYCTETDVMKVDRAARRINPFLREHYPRYRR